MEIFEYYLTGSMDRIDRSSEYCERYSRLLARATVSKEFTTVSAAASYAFQASRCSMRA